MRKITVMIAVATMVFPSVMVPASAQRRVRERVIVIEDDNADTRYDRGYYDGHDRGYERGYDDGRDAGTIVQVEDRCKRRKGKGAVIGALGGGLLGHLTSDRNKFANTAIGALGGGLLGDLVGKRGTDYDC